MYGSSHSDLRPAAWDKLLRHYHTELNHILIQLKYPRRIPTFSDIDSAMANCGIHSVLLVLYIIGLRNMKAVHEDIFRKFLGNSTENESYRVEFFSNPKCFAELKFMLKFFDDKGLLDQFGKYWKRVCAYVPTNEVVSVWKRVSGRFTGETNICCFHNSIRQWIAWFFFSRTDNASSVPITINEML